MRQTFTGKIWLLFDKTTETLEWSALMAYRELQDPKAEVERLFSAKGFHLLYDRPTEYKASAWEVVHSRRNKDGSLTQRVRPVQDVHVFSSAAPGE